jgi:hypothetical protein
MGSCWELELWYPAAMAWHVQWPSSMEIRSCHFVGVWYINSLIYRKGGATYHSQALTCLPAIYSHNEFSACLHIILSSTQFMCYICSLSVGAYSQSRKVALRKVDWGFICSCRITNSMSFGMQILSYVHIIFDCRIQFFLWRYIFTKRWIFMWHVLLPSWDCYPPMSISSKILQSTKGRQCGHINYLFK